MTRHVEVMDLVTQLKAAEEAFVLATVVRTFSVTAAKAGAKAVIRPDGTIAAGWSGGGRPTGRVVQAGPRAPGRCRAADGLGAAGRPAPRSWGEARRKPRRRPL